MTLGTIAQLRAQSLAEVASSTSSDALDRIRIRYLG